MSIPALPYQVMDMLAEGMAVLDRNGRVVYANRVFRNLFNLFPQAMETSTPPGLISVIQAFYRSKKMEATDSIVIPSIGEVFGIYIYSLRNFPKGQGFALIMVKKEQHQELINLMMTEHLINTSIDIQKVFLENLDPEFAELRGEDLSFKASLTRAQKAARTDLPVLIRGESGTGKEILARIIHRVSARRTHNFVDINCSAIPDNLIESELFGYEKGAFTGALREGKKGLFQEANQGTIFLDEIGNASGLVQAKLLRVLQEGCYKKIGGTRNVTVDVRIISATNQSLESLVSENLFRDDLYYRLNTFSITLPPLRNRGNDVRLLAESFLQEHASEQSRDLSFSEEALRIMESYKWPGNVRELKAVVDFAFIMNDDMEIGAGSLPPFLFSGRSLESKEEAFHDFDWPASARNRLLPGVVQMVEKKFIKRAIERSHNLSEAIRLCGISRRTFYTKTKKYGLR